MTYTLVYCSSIIDIVKINAPTTLLLIYIIRTFPLLFLSCKYTIYTSKLSDFTYYDLCID